MSRVGSDRESRFLWEEQAYTVHRVVDSMITQPYIGGSTTKHCTGVAVMLAIHKE